jgi:hypothetical protein
MQIGFRYLLGLDRVFLYLFISSGLDHHPPRIKRYTIFNSEGLDQCSMRQQVQCFSPWHDLSGLEVGKLL